MEALGEIQLWTGVMNLIALTFDVFVVVTGRLREKLINRILVGTAF